MGEDDEAANKNAYTRETPLILYSFSLNCCLMSQEPDGGKVSSTII